MRLWSIRRPKPELITSALDPPCLIGYSHACSIRLKQHLQRGEMLGELMSDQSGAAKPASPPDKSSAATPERMTHAIAWGEKAKRLRDVIAKKGALALQAGKVEV